MTTVMYATRAARRWLGGVLREREELMGAGDGWSAEGAFVARLEAERLLRSCCGGGAATPIPVDIAPRSGVRFRRSAYPLPAPRGRFP
jgi:hypothetical protein